MGLNQGIVRSQSLKLVRSSLELDTGELGDLGSNLDIKAFLGVQTLERCKS